MKSCTDALNHLLEQRRGKGEEQAKRVEQQVVTEEEDEDDDGEEKEYVTRSPAEKVTDF